LGQEAVEVMKKIKQALDPDGLLSSSSTTLFFLASKNRDYEPQQSGGLSPSCIEQNKSNKERS